MVAMAFLDFLHTLDFKDFISLLLLIAALVFLKFGKFPKGCKFSLLPSTRQSSDNLPGPLGYPVLGHLPMLGPAPHKTLTLWSKMYGSVYQLQLGTWHAVIINGYKAVHEALVKQGDTFASRPGFKTFQHYAQGASISFHPYDTSLKMHRKLTSSALKVCALGGAQIGNTEDLIRREGMELIKKWKDKSPDGIDPNEDIILAVAGILYSLCFGHDKRVKYDKAYVDILTTVNPATELFGAGNHVDLMPLSWLFTRRSSHRNNVKRMEKMSQLNRHKCQEYMEKSHQDDHNILGYMINVSKKQTEEISQRQLLNTTVEFLSAGTETSSTTLLWLLLYMAYYPKIASKVAMEIQDVIGDDHPPSFADRLQLPYTEATMLEVMRLTTIVPFALPHSTVRSTHLGGFNIPKDTLVFVNLWSVSRDPTSWERPEVFQPERFLIQEGGRLVINRELTRKVLPFSEGKRRCIGETLGKVQVFILFTLIMQTCRISRMQGSDLDLNGSFGDILKPKPFELSVIVK